MTHKDISYIESAIRIIGYILLLVAVLPAALVLIVSEAVGVWEEWGEED